MRKLVAILASMIIAVLVFASMAFADTTTPPVPGAVPATPVTTTVTTPGPTVTTVTSQTLTEAIRTYQVKTHKKVVFYQVEKGLGNVKGCVSPVRKGWIKAGQKFENTWDVAGSDGKMHRQRFIGTWKKGDLLCGAKEHGKGKNATVSGTIKRCGNADVKIHFSQKVLKKRKVVKVAEFVSRESFVKKTAQQINTTTTTTTTTTVTYTCPTGFTLNGTWCVPPQPPTGKDPSKGPGTTTPGQPGGTGSSGTPGSGDGSKCRNNAGDIVDGKADQFGYCSTV